MSCKLYYRKFCLNAPKVYSSKTDVHSNRKCKILFCKCDSTNFELVSKFTSYSLYYRKFCLGVYSQAKLMFIQTGSAKFYFASATAQILNLFQNLLPIVYFLYYKEKLKFLNITTKNKTKYVYYTNLPCFFINNNYFYVFLELSFNTFIIFFSIIIV